MDVLTTVGGQTIAILAIAQFLLQHYQDFAYIKSLSKNLYHEPIKDATDNPSAMIDEDNTWAEHDFRAKMREQMQLKSDFSMSYCTYSLLKLV